MLFGHLQRREVIVLLGGAATWPLAARGQQPDRMRRIGVLTGADEAATAARYPIFVQALQQLGWIDGSNN